MRAITLIFSTLKKIIKWKRSSLRQSFLKVSVTGNLHHLMIGSTKLFINSDSQKEILLNWDQLRWFNQLKRGRIVLTRLAGKNQEILEATDLDSHTTIPLICRGSHGNTRVIFYRFNANLLCKLASYCVDFGVNFIFQNFCPWKKRTNIRYDHTAMTITKT